MLGDTTVVHAKAHAPRHVLCARLLDGADERRRRMLPDMFYVLGCRMEPTSSEGACSPTCSMCSAAGRSRRAAKAHAPGHVLRARLPDGADERRRRMLPDMFYVLVRCGNSDCPGMRGKRAGCGMTGSTGHFMGRVSGSARMLHRFYGTSMENDIE